MNGRRLSRVIEPQRNHTAADPLALEQPRGRISTPQAVEYLAVDSIGIVHRETPVDRNFVAVKGPRLTRRRPGVQNAVVVSQIFRDSRCGVLRQIGWARAPYSLPQANPACFQPAVLEHADAYGHVDALFDQIDETVA